MLYPIAIKNIILRHYITGNGDRKYKLHIIVYIVICISISKLNIRALPRGARSTLQLTLSDN